MGPRHLARTTDRLDDLGYVDSGGVFALIALIVYLVSVRPAVQYISDQLDNIAEMAQIVRSGYNWITDKLNSILCSVLESLLRKL